MAERTAATDSVIWKTKRATKPDDSALYWLPILERPKDQIRLLYMLDGKEDDCIVCRLEAWDRKSAPPYKAVSYTWGEDENHKAIELNGILCNVRSNAHYALWQVRLHHPGSYVWIDSICINQRNLEEKSQQVAMMANVYKSAALTCACIGPAGANSNLLNEFFGAIGSVALPYEDSEYHDEYLDRKHGSPNSGFSLAFARFWSSWCLAHSADDVNRITAGLLTFMQRPYWKRLWIIQEISLSKSVDVLHGRHQSQWQSIRRVLWLSEIIGEDIDQHMIGSFKELVEISFSTVLAFGCWARTVDYFECNDVRDKIYGLLDIVLWPAGVVAIEPDYTKSAVQLAGSLVRFMQDAMQFADLTAIARGLGITAHNNEVSKLVERRRHVVESAPGYTERSSLEVGMLCAAVRADHNDILRCSVHRVVDEFPGRLELHAKFVHRLENSHSTTLGAWREVWFDNEIAAIVCNDIQEGDFIAVMDRRGSPALILRHVRDVHFIVIGQGFLLPAFTICFNGNCRCPRDVDHDSQRLYLEIEMSLEDMVLFVGQDVVPSNSQCDLFEDLGYDVDARCARPRTRVSEFMTTSARVVPDLMFKYQPTPEIVAAMREGR